MTISTADLQAAMVENTNRHRRPRGAFINTAQANCSIFESGRMVYGCIEESEAYRLDYFSLDAFDVGHFAATGVIRPIGSPAVSAPGIPEGYDFWVFNWHPYTMAPHLANDSIARLPGPKFTIVLELAPDDPLKMVPPGVFDGYIALDPAAPATAQIFPFPRPLEGDPHAPAPKPHGVPVIGSFGFGTPGKGFELLVEAVNREFERAVIRINIPSGTYVSTDVIHLRDYPRHVGGICERIAKPGVSVVVTHDFMSPEEVVDWCAGNDLNCFMYTRCQPGLSATTDQAIMSGRPLLTLSNDTFRHIHRYIPPFPAISLREAIETTVPAVQRIQRDWSRESFNRTFHRMLAGFGMIAARAPGENTLMAADQPPVVVMVASRHGREARDIIHYDSRLADCLGRSGKYRVVRTGCSDLADLEIEIAEHRPSAVILVDHGALGLEGLAAAVRGVTGPKILLVDESPDSPTPSDVLQHEILVLRRRSIIPFFTVHVHLRQPTDIGLIGFASEQSNLEQLVAKIAAEAPGVQVSVATTDDELRSLEPRVARLRDRFGATIQISVAALPARGDELIDCLAAYSLVVLYHDPARAAYLEDVSSLAMITERPVVFTRSAPVPAFEAGATFVEDFSIPDVIASGMAAHVSLLHDFGEWQLSADIDKALRPRSASERRQSADSGLRTDVMTAGHILSLPDKEFVSAAYEAILRRAPDPEGQRNYLSLLSSGTPRPTILAALRLSPEGRKQGADFPGLTSVVVRHRLSELPLVRAIVRIKGCISKIGDRRAVTKGAAGPAATAKDILDLRGNAFITAAYKAVLGRLPDEAGRRNYLGLLVNGTSPSTILADLRLSPEGRLRAADFPGLAAILRRRRLLETPGLGSVLTRLGWSADRIDVQRSLRVVENRLHRLLAAGNAARTTTEPAAEPAAPALQLTEGPPAAPAPGPAVTPAATAKANHRRSVFLLAGGSGGPAAAASPFVRHLADGWFDRDDDLCVVTWDAANKHFRLAAPEELGRMALPKALADHAAGRFGEGDMAVVLQRASCGRDDWLLVPEAPAPAAGPGELVELNTILEAKRLGLRCAFVFHGAEALRLPRFAGAAAQACEQYMQALLLADLVIPVSRLAAEDLIDFFVQHQKADFVPMIRKVPPPAEIDADDAGQWHRYAGDVDDLLAGAADPSRFLRALYYWVDSSPAAEPRDSCFEDQLARALADRGISVIPVTWDASARALMAADKATVVPWSAWVDCQQPAAPDWLLIPNGVDVEISAEISAFAAKRRIRVAGILHEAVEPAPTSEKREFEALAHLDKVLAVSSRRFAEFQRFLLSWRGKLHSAEDRFKTLALPAGEGPAWASYARDLAVELATDRVADCQFAPLAASGRDVYSTLVNLHRRPILSLCISTYNRAGWLGVNLRNIFSQIPVERADLEVLVVDNTSTDATPEVVTPYLHRRDFRYLRNPRNVGMLGNLAVTAQQARGEYIWILGDDDLTRPGVIEKVLELIQQRPGIGLIYLNYGYTSEQNPQSVVDLSAFLTNFNILEPAGPDVEAPVKLLAAKCENFYTAIYSHIYKRDHGMRAYCQETSGRIFSTMVSCIPTAYYVLNYMADSPAYWIGEPALVVNSNVSWSDYGPMLDLEHLPRAWDLAERMGCPPAEVDRRRANRLWLVEMMWRDIFENDRAGNSAYFSALRVLMRLKHLPAIDKFIPEFRAIYQRAHDAGHPAATLDPADLFLAFAAVHLSSPE